MFKNKKILLQTGVAILLCVIVFIFILQRLQDNDDRPAASPTSLKRADIEDLPPVEFTTIGDENGGIAGNVNDGNGNGNGNGGIADNVNDGNGNGGDAGINGTADGGTGTDDGNVTVTADSTDIRFREGETWQKDGKYYAKYTALIHNPADKPFARWEIKADITAGTYIEKGNSWNGVFTTYETMPSAETSAERLPQILNIKNIDFNASVKADGHLSGIDFILTNDRETPQIIPGTVKLSYVLTDKADAVVDMGNPDYVKQAPVAYTPDNTKAPGDDDWLHTKGNRILNKENGVVRLTGLNWFGYNTGSYCFDGLWSANLEQSLQAVANRGFNVIRLPLSVELIKDWQNGKYHKPNINESTNAAYVGLNDLQLFDETLRICKTVGIKIIPDIHSVYTKPDGHIANLWYDDKAENGYSEEDFFSALEWLAERYKDDDTIIGIDLYNEPHSDYDTHKGATWDTSIVGTGIAGTADGNSATDWARAAGTAGKRVLAKNPRLLIIVEGISEYKGHYAWWGSQLRGVADTPVTLGGAEQTQLVYSAHDYGDSVSPQTWLKNGFTFDSIMKDYWRDTWFFIHEDGIAPLYIGEWGGYLTEPTLSWLKCARKLIVDNELSHTFWAFNNNSGDTGGLVYDDFVTWDEAKYEFVKPTLAFAGLDHVITLGGKAA